MGMRLSAKTAFPLIVVLILVACSTERNRASNYDQNPPVSSSSRELPRVEDPLLQRVDALTSDARRREVEFQEAARIIAERAAAAAIVIPVIVEVTPPATRAVMTLPPPMPNNSGEAESLKKSAQTPRPEVPTESPAAADVARLQRELDDLRDEMERAKCEPRAQTMVIDPWTGKLLVPIFDVVQQDRAADRLHNPQAYAATKAAIDPCWRYTEDGRNAVQKGWIK